MAQRDDQPGGGGEGAYRLLFQGLAAPVLVADPEGGRILACNAAAAALYGWAPGALDGQPLSVVSTDPARTLQAPRQGGQPAPVHLHARRDGSRFPAEVTASEVAWGGRPAALLVVRDVTAQARAEEALRESKALVEAVVENVPLMVFLKEATDLRFVMFNKAGEELVGYDRATFLGKNNLDLFPPEQAAHFQAKDREVLDGPAGALDIPEEDILTAKKGLRLLHTRKVCIRGADGTTKYLLGVSEDITERKRVDEALRASERRFREIFMASPVPLAINGPDGRVTALNAAFVATFGWTQQDVRTLDDWWPLAYPDPAYRARIAGAWGAELERAARAGEPVRPMEVTVRCKDGSERVALVSAAPVSTPAGAEHLVVLFDLTELKRLQGSLAQADRLSAMGMLAAGVAHEINNPLAYVMGHIEAVAQELPRLATADGPGEAARRAELVACVEAALEGLQRIRGISQRLGAFTRVERVELAEVDLNLAIQAAVTMAANEVKYRARLEVDLGRLPPVLGSDGKLSQVFLNLVLNAAHAIEEGRAEAHRISVRSWAEGGEVVAEVADTGHGIRPEDLERIFEPFFTTKPLGAGSGLGLAISRNIVTELGGTLQVESQPGHGARFTVRLPASGGAPGRPPAPAPARGPAAPAVRGRVLVVDDEDQVRRVLLRTFTPQHEVVTAATGQEARDLLERDPAFDVVLCDLMMPALTGMDLHAWLAERDPGLAGRLVFMSGGAFTPRATSYLAAVGNPQVEKPFDLAGLRALVADLVARSRGGGQG